MQPQEKITNNNSNSQEVPFIASMKDDLLIKNDTESFDSGAYVQDIAEKHIRNRKIIFTIFTILIIIILSAFAYFYYIQKYKNANLNKVNSKDLTKTLEVKKYFIYDVWQGVEKDSFLKENTGEATSTKDIILIDVKSFEKLYPYIIQNEYKIGFIAKNKYKYTNFGDFQNATIENIDMRIADCNEGAIVYGYIDKNKLLITNDIGEYIKIYKKVKSVK